MYLVVDIYIWDFWLYMFVVFYSQFTINYSLYVDKHNYAMTSLLWMMSSLLSMCRVSVEARPFIGVNRCIHILITPSSTVRIIRMIMFWRDTPWLLSCFLKKGRVLMAKSIRKSLRSSEYLCLKLAKNSSNKYGWQGAELPSPQRGWYHFIGVFVHTIVLCTNGTAYKQDPTN